MIIIFILCGGLKRVISTAKAKLGVQSINGIEEGHFRPALGELSHQQTLTPIHYSNDKNTPVGRDTTVHNIVHALWRCIYFGSQTKSHISFLMFSNTPGKKTLPITSQKYLMKTPSRCAHGTIIRIILLDLPQGQYHLSL